jgi:C-terminal processing protease CtpA/Prc
VPQIQNPKSKIENVFFVALLFLAAMPTVAQDFPVLKEIDRHVREEFWDPKLKGVDWDGAVQRAAAEVAKAKDAAESDAAYDRLLATLDDSHSFRVPSGRLPEHAWGTAGLRIGRDGDGYGVKGVVPGYAAERARMKPGDRVLSIGGRRYGKERVNFRDLFLVFEGQSGSELEVVWQPAGAGAPRTDRLKREREEPADSLVWKSARVLRRDEKTFGYVRLWGVRPESALALVDLLLDRAEAVRARPELSGWDAIEGLLLDVRGNSGGYDPNILTTFLRGQWSAGDYVEVARGARRLVPPVYKKLSVALLVNSGTASEGELLALRFRVHGIGPVVGEETAGMASGGAAATKLSDGSTLWLSRRAIEDKDGRSYEGRGFTPDVVVADRPAASPGREDAIVEAGLKALVAQKAVSGKQ